MHKEKDHRIKQTFQNLVIGYEIDFQGHVEVLKPMDEPIDTLKCSKCEYKSCSDGKIEMHKTEYHQELYIYLPTSGESGPKHG
jgi:hypothetical protein